MEKKKGPTMTPHPPRAGIEAIRAANSKACDLLAHLCNEKWAGRDGWHWEIPANPEKDTDLIIGDSLGHIPTLCDEVESLRAEVEKLREGLESISTLEKARQPK